MSLLLYRVGGCSLKENWCKSWGGYGKFHTFQFGLANGVERVKGEGGDMVDFCLEKILYNSINGDLNWWTFLDAVVRIIEDQLYFYLLLPTYFTKRCNCNFFSDPNTIPPLASHSYYTGGMHTTNTFQNVLIMKNSTGSHLYSKFRLSLAQSGFRIGYWKKLTYYITSYHYPTFGL